ncbi:NAD(P)-binding domain-containing protein [Streptomyces sp. NBC_01218]|uniref:NADPH-dependent F420 reductase n=1 Tax=unclassified Streptomyces TaxID=2593676 RepID=UPI0023B93E7A|nr:MULTISPECIES: NAD(P)-binding domain-containing protein [unclassified Streptomyces]WEH42638.1 NAD(P)-binding domain-containing protein [Streptomyces sp. AM 2-1-1]WSQ54262.1 NAD(P)-binding domain-containing protein [Streptomyces sp. NBC_01218]
MRIGILGTGNMAEALGARWAAAGHEILFGGRSAERARDLADRAGGLPGTLGEAAHFGDAALVALPHGAVADVLAELGAAHGALRHRVLIDCTNAIGPGLLLTTGDGPGAARTLARSTGARVVKAFNHLPDSVWRLDPSVLPEGPFAVPLCGDDEAALETVRTLVRDLGHVPLTVGPLARVDQLEAATALLIGLWKSGHDPRTLLPPFGTVTAGG